MRGSPYAHYLRRRDPTGLGQAQAQQPQPAQAVPLPTPVYEREEPTEEAPIPVMPGALAQYYSDLASGIIVPEDMRPEDLLFRVQINPAGEVTFEDPAVTLISRYNLAIRRVIGLAMDPELAGAAPYLVRFNIREEGRNFDLFKRPVSMQSLLSRPGAGTVTEWDGVYITVPGTDLSVSWSVDTARWPALVGASREFGIQVIGDYVACAPTPR